MHLKRFLNISLPEGQSCFLWGARKTGKSTYLKEKFSESTYINLLQADVYQKYSRNPDRLREEVRLERNTTIIIDEVQKVPILLDEVHFLIEPLAKLQLC